MASMKDIKIYYIKEKCLINIRRFISWSLSMTIFTNTL